MSFTPEPKPSQPDVSSSSLSPVVLVAQYAVLAVVIVAVAVLIALGRVSAEAGLALIGALGGLHGGLALRS